MKTTIKSAILLLVMMTTLVQCDERGLNDGGKQYVMFEMKSLAKLGLSKTSSMSDFTSFENKFRSLNAEELNLFDDYLIDEMREAMKAQGADRSIMDFNLTRLRNYRKALNETSVKDYGLPYNQLANADFDALLSKVYDENEFGLLHSGESVQSGRTNSCTVVYYPRNLSYASTNSVGCSGWRDVTVQGQTDCDYEFTFPFPNQNKIWSDYPALNIALSAGGIKSLAYGGFDTRAQIGKGRIDLAGGPGWCQGGLRMGL